MDPIFVHFINNCKHKLRTDTMGINARILSWISKLSKQLIVHCSWRGLDEKSISSPYPVFCLSMSHSAWACLSDHVWQLCRCWVASRYLVRGRGYRYITFIEARWASHAWSRPPPSTVYNLPAHLLTQNTRIRMICQSYMLIVD